MQETKLFFARLSVDEATRAYEKDCFGSQNSVLDHLKVVNRSLDERIEKTNCKAKVYKYLETMYQSKCEEKKI